MFASLLRNTILLFVLLHVILCSPVLSSQVSSNGSTDESVYKEVISGKRSILAIGKLAHSSQQVLLAGKLTNPDDIYVFESTVNQTTNTSKFAMSGGEPIRTKWPAMATKLVDLSVLFLVSDFNYDYLVILTNDAKAFAYNIEQDKVDEIGRNFTPTLPMVSSVEQLCSFSFSKSLFSRYGFFGPSNKTAQVLQNMSQMYKLDTFRICSTATRVIALPDDAACFGGSTDANWNIQTGFVDTQQITLFDQIGTVIIFSKSLLDSDLGIWIELTSTNLSEYLNLFGKCQACVGMPPPKEQMSPLKVLIIIMLCAVGFLSLYQLIAQQFCPSYAIKCGGHNRLDDILRSESSKSFESSDDSTGEERFDVPPEKTFILKQTH